MVVCIPQKEHSKRNWQEVSYNQALEVSEKHFHHILLVKQLRMLKGSRIRPNLSVEGVERICGSLIYYKCQGEEHETHSFLRWEQCEKNE